jgi:hypothetical protein
MRKIQKQLKVFLSRAGVDPSRLPEAVETFERRFKDYYGIEFQAIDDQGEYIEHNNERLTPSKYINAIKAGELGTPEEKTYFINYFMNEAIRGSRGASGDPSDMNQALRRAAGFEDDKE